MDEEDSEPGHQTPVNCQNSLDLKYIKLYELNDTTFSTAKIKQHFQNFEEVLLGTNLLLLLHCFIRGRLCDSIDGSPSGSPVPGILQAKTLEWVAISFSNAFMHAKSLQSHPTLCAPMDRAHQAPLSSGFSRQEYWSGLPFPSPFKNLIQVKAEYKYFLKFCGLNTFTSL